MLEADGYEVVGEAADGASGIAAVQRAEAGCSVARRAASGHRRLRRGLAAHRRRSTVRTSCSRRAATARTSARSSTRSGARGFVPKGELSGAAIGRIARMSSAAPGTARARRSSALLYGLGADPDDPRQRPHRRRGALRACRPVGRLVVHRDGPVRLVAAPAEPVRRAAGRRRLRVVTRRARSPPNMPAIFVSALLLGERLDRAARARAAGVSVRPPRDPSANAGSWPRLDRRDCCSSSRWSSSWRRPTRTTATDARRTRC